ncbi:hypothetical protein [Pelagibaculum spongiae]|uniref:DUF2357 domain-containing protein n=1 Tax=Pelagibaculum spongiae TaxID=2080658 RepID=A0A2V1GVS3_9GAMM|nr:hypothetical protein [Pelagibaculum spongiae]PVZ64501.1 hypothetical protein DC094_19505 [Pelagibaculum spongiae]
MIKLMDRITHQQINLENLPEQIVPGRYQVLSDVEINAHSTLSAGTVLAGDGSTKLHVNSQSFTCNEKIEDKEHDAQNKFCCQALEQIIESCSGVTELSVSPLIPSQLFTDESQLNQLEEELELVLQQGHINEISVRPRFDMRYDELVQPIGRAKKLANSAHRHLAAHSECWQSRTLTGIRPKKVLGMVSDDEFNLYENRVYARLLDRLERFLSKRLHELIALENNLCEALEFGDSSELAFLLRKELCFLWGKTFSKEAAHDALEKLQATQKSIEQQIKRIRGFIQGPLYKKIPRNQQVNGQLQATNILSHDQHYRYLRTLWNSLQKESKLDQLTPQEKFEHNLNLQTFYIDYHKLILSRALSQLGFQSVSSGDDQEYIQPSTGRRLQLKKTETDSWQLTDALSKNKVRFVPIATWHSSSLLSSKQKDTLVIPCCFYSEASHEPSEWLIKDKQPAMQVSPLNFYVEEQLITLINQWLMAQSIKLYRTPITRVPTPVMQLANGYDWLVKNDDHKLQVIQSASTEDVQAIQHALKKANAKQSLTDLNSALDALKTLETCPFCQKTAEFHPRQHGAFIAQCKQTQCRAEWKLDIQQGQPHFLLTANQTPNEYKLSGRWYGSFALGEI